MILILDAATQRGDGYGGAGAMVLYMLLAILLTAGGVIAGFRRRERWSWLAIVAVALWCLPVLLMV